MTSTTLHLSMNWKPPCDECFCCQLVEKLCKGLNVAKLLKQNKKLIGRSGIGEKVWSFSMISNIKNSIVTTHDSEIDIEELKNEFNPHLQLCQCNLCGKIPKQPVTLKKCEHLFCFFCIVENIKVKKLNETSCPKCKELILPEDLVTSVKTNSLLNMLTVECICKKNTM
ncbi:V(D)J recombination-activating protein 1-like [Hydra vulgaris]|uniref:V(D)J recombination-activating protein 1-like n=1 Tax=Hydra vulgaris TaxID=6087 RepID=UPI0032EA400D